MVEFNPKKANVHKEFQEFWNSIWHQHRFAVITIIIIFFGFFIPSFNILIWLYASVAVPFLLYKNAKIQKAFKFKKYKNSLSFIILFVIVFVGFSIPVFAYNSLVTPVKETVEVVKEDTAKLEAERQKRTEAENKAQDEETKRIEAERQKQELEVKIAESQIINPNYDVDSDLEAQPVEVAQQANLAIAALGRETKDQKLFDVVSVIDGDTIKVSELGSLRLIGIDTPETRDPRKPVQCFGVEASNRAKELLSGKKVYLEFDPANRIDKFGRTLAYVYREDGYFFNAEMVRDGFANSYTKFPHPRLEEFNGYSKSAREGQKGLWSATTCNGDATQALVQTPAPIVIAPVPTRSSSTPKTTAPTPSKANSSTQKTTTPAPAKGGFIAGTCKSLNEKGLGNFRPGDPNYTAGRDGNKDGVACEM